jgi:prepilin-type N-terminal cleavage/methylation domain-containing protein
MDLFKSKKGYTLLEMIISMAIFGVLLVVFTQIIFSALRISNEISVRSQFRETITEVIDLIKRDIRNADAVGECNGTKCVIAFDTNVEWELCPPEEGVNRICK